MYLVDYQLYEFLFVQHSFGFLCNRVPWLVVHDCVINASNVKSSGKMWCIRGGNTIICTSSKWRCSEIKMLKGIENSLC